MRSQRLVVTMALVVLLGALATPVNAAFPGRNGRIAFSSEDTIYSVNPNGSGLGQLTNDGHSDEPEWSPDGTRVVYVCKRGRHIYSPNSQICVMHADGPGKRVVTHSDVGKEDPSWSPNGRRIIFSMGTEQHSDLWIVKLNGSHLHRVTRSRGPDLAPEWSPRANVIAFVRPARAWPHDGDIFLVGPDGSRLRNVTRTKHRNEQEPDWAPNDRWIAFDAESGQSRRIFAIRPDGSDQRKISHGRKGTFDLGPAWSPNGNWIAFSRQGRIMKAGRFGRRSRAVYRRGDSYLPDWQPTPR